MALVDFYGLAVLYKLHCGNVVGGPHPSHSHPPPMPAAAPAPSVSHPLADGLNQAVPFPLPPPGPAPKTLQHQRIITQSQLQMTPTGHGTAILPKLEACMGQAPKYCKDKYHNYLVRDFETHRVFVDIDIIMERVLKVPNKWRKVWRPTIEQIKRDDEFMNTRIEYTKHCGRKGSLESDLYSGLVLMANAVYKICNASADKSVVPTIPQCYLLNEPKHVVSGVMNEQSPDIVAVHEECVVNSEDPEKPKLSWAHPLRVLEVKSSGGALVDGSCIPTLVMEGEHPTSSRDSSWS